MIITIGKKTNLLEWHNVFFILWTSSNYIVFHCIIITDNSRCDKIKMFFLHNSTFSDPSLLRDFIVPAISPNSDPQEE